LLFEVFGEYERKFKYPQISQDHKKAEMLNAKNNYFPYCECCPHNQERCR